MSFPGHPYLQPHPWHDPLAVPPPLGVERPTWEFEVVGAHAPRPQDFEFNEAGRAAYYHAVRETAWATQQRQQAAFAMQAVGGAQPAVETRPAEQCTAPHADNWLLLLL